MLRATTASPKPSFRGTSEGGRQSRSAEELLDGQHQRLDIPARSGTAHSGLPQKTGKGSLLNRPSCLLPPPLPPGRSNRSRGWTELNCIVSVKVPTDLETPGGLEKRVSRCVYLTLHCYHQIIPHYDRQPG